MTGRKAQPSYWDNKISQHFKLNGNFCLTGNTHNSKAYATEAAAIAYAMWVSLDFYLLVVDVFLQVRHNLDIAIQLNGIKEEKIREMSKHEGKLNYDVLKAKADLTRQQEALGLDKWIASINKPNAKSILPSTLAKYLGIKTQYVTERYVQKGWLIRQKYNGGTNYIVTAAGSKHLDERNYGKSKNYLLNPYHASTILEHRVEYLRSIDAIANEPA